MSVASGLKQEFKSFKRRRSGSAFHFNVVDTGEQSGQRDLHLHESNN
jgi:hypothetical protein